MFGPDLLIAPVLEPGARTRDVYLPAGTAWIDAATGEQARRGNRHPGAPVRQTASLSSLARKPKCLMSSAKRGGPVQPSSSAWRPLGADEIQVTGGIWGQRQRLNADTILRHCETWMERIGWAGNFDRAAAGTIAGRHSRHRVRRLRDLQAARSHGLGTGPRAHRPALRTATGRWPNGSPRPRSPTATCTPASGGPGSPRGTPTSSPGTSSTASATFSRRRSRGCGPATTTCCPRWRAAWRITSTTSSAPAAGPASAAIPEIEMALVELARATGEDRYLELARLLVERRGTGTLRSHRFGQEYFQDDVPVRGGGHAARPRGARPLPRFGRARRGHGDQRRRAGGGGSQAMGERRGPPHLHHRRSRLAPPGRGVRRRLRAAGRPRLRRDVRRASRRSC